MRALAINSSPKMDRGKTAEILGPFLEGMSETGAEVELIYTKKLKINTCQGCLNCWLKTPGKCFQNDDMQQVLPKMGGADIWIFATPVYFDTANGPMKNLMDRMIPLLEPFYELRDGHCRHPLRKTTKPGKVVLVSTCGFWEIDNFDPLLTHMRAFCRTVNREFAGALLRPHGGRFFDKVEMGVPLADLFSSAKEAGRQLAREGSISPAALKVISSERVSLERFIQIGNKRIQEILDALGSDRA